MDKEIVKACIKYKNKLFTGFDHGECFDNLLKEEQPKDMTELEQGFIDNELNFVDRKSAMVIANIAGQLKFKPVKETLISEDLHLDWLNRQAKQIADLEVKLAESEKKYETLYKLFSEQHEIIDQMELECFDEVNRLLKEQKDFYIVEKTEYEKMKQGAKEIIDQLKQQIIEEKNRNKKLNHEAQKYYEDAYCNGFQNKKAIEELEKLKHDICINQQDDGWLDEKVDIYELTEMIDQQIKSLKGEKENV